MIKRQPIGPFTKGMNTLADETAIPENQCRKARNVDFDKDGNWERRQGFSKIINGLKFHSLYSPPNTSHLLGCQNNTIGVFDLTNLSYTSLVTMPVAYKTSWAFLSDEIYASNPGFNCRINPETYVISTVAVPLPQNLSLAATAGGGMREGSYTIAYSITNSNGEESPLSEELQVAVEEGGGVAITGVPIDPSSNLRIYASTANGEELYRVLDTPMVATSYSLGVQQNKNTGAQPETRFLQELPKGHIIRAFKSRLFVASENCLYFSDAFRPHLHNPRFNFFLFNSTITMVAPVETGIFVSDQHSVSFLRGEDAEQFTLVDTDADPAIYGSALVIPGAHLNSELSRHDAVVIWLSKTGHILGLPDGSILRLNPDQISLPSYYTASAAMTRRNGIKRVVIPVNSNRLTGTGTALDSEIF